MFGRGKQAKFEITEHPDVLKALEAMWQQAYSAGRRDAMAIVSDLRDELRSDGDDGRYIETESLLERLES